MFEKIILRRSESGPSLSLGELAEALLFYQNVHIVLDRGILVELVKSIGFDGVLSLLSRPNVSAVYIEEILGTMTNTYGVIQHHTFNSIFISGHGDLPPFKGRKQRLEYSLTSIGYDKNASRRFVERFRRIVPFKSYSDDYYLTGGVINAATEDLNDPIFVHEAMRRILVESKGVNPLLGDFKFEVMRNQSGFYIFTDIDFKSINEIRKNNLEHLDDMTPAGLINEILIARADTALAAHYGGEFYTSNLTSQIIRLRYKEVLRRIGIEMEEIKQWQDITIPNTPSIKEVVNSQERSFSEFLKLLDKSQKFRDWVQSVNPDEKVVQAYLREVTSEGWINSTPTKILRYVLGCVIDSFEPISGKLFSAADSLLVERIFKGWRPNHFVDDRLKPFVKFDEQ